MSYKQYGFYITLIIVAVVAIGVIAGDAFLSLRRREHTAKLSCQNGQIYAVIFAGEEIVESLPIATSSCGKAVES